MAIDQQLIDFMNSTSKCLGRIEKGQEVEAEERKKLQKCIDEVDEKCKRISPIEIGLNNHLKTHDRLQNRLTYPLLVVVSGGVILTIIKYVFHLF